MKMKIVNKTLVAICLLALIACSTKEPGIEFFHGTWEQALEKSKNENKSLFVDVYTSWCGPCKMLSKKVFVQKAVGDYFNENFICFKLQADDKEGKNRALVNKLKATAYPTLMWLNHKEEVLHVSTGYKNAEKLINEAKISLDTENRLGEALKKWENGDRSFEVGKKFFANDANMSGEFDAFFMSLSDEQKMDEDLFHIIVFGFNLSTKGEAFKYMCEHRAEFGEIIGKNRFDRFLQRQIEPVLTYTKGTEVYAKEVERFRSYGLPLIDMIEAKILCYDYLKNKEYDKFALEADQVLTSYGKDYPYLYLTFLFKIKSIKNEEVLNSINGKEMVLKCAQKYDDAISDKYESNRIYVHAYRFIGNKEKALEAAQNAINDLNNNPKHKDYKESSIESLKKDIEKIRKM